MEETNINTLETSQMPGLGRLVSLDARDKNFRMRAALAPITVTRSVAFWETGPVLNQGATYECTAYSAEQLLLSAPVKNKMYLTPHELYHLNQLNDEWPGENYDGSSVRAAMKVLQTAGLIGEYVWANSIDPVRRWLLMKGPVILGTNWYAGMMSPDSLGFIRPTGASVGGHAYMLRGADDNMVCPDRSKGAVRIINSWGLQYGQQGKVWLSYNDADKLIKELGEAVTPIEQYNVTPRIITGVIQ
jgi:hypothetical protein